MNPSTAGWIDKFGSIVKDNDQRYTDFQQLYGGLKKTGFVYGINIKIPRFITVEHDLSTGRKSQDKSCLPGFIITYNFQQAGVRF